MIRYTLKCDAAHLFESWFKSAAAYDKLLAAQMISCAVCGSNTVQKAIMAPVVRPARAAAGKTRPRPAPPLAATPPTPPSLCEPASDAEKAVRALRAKIEATSENVGRDFAREARAIHHGEAPERAIIGEVAPDEARSLIDDGVPVAPLPWSNRKTN